MLAIFMTIENDGERRLAEELYLSYRGRMYGIAYSVLHNREDAEDAVMDAVYNIVNNISRFVSLPRNKTESLIVIIVRNAAINRYNRNRRRGVLPLEEAVLAQTLGLQEEAMRQETRRELLETVNSLDEPGREILVRRYYYDQKPRQIALALGMTVKQVDNSLYRSKRLLREKLSQAWGGAE